MTTRQKNYFMGLGLLFLQLLASVALAQEAMVSIVLHPAGSFKVRSSAVTGAATKTSDGYQANNIVVDVRNVVTGISLRDTHTRKHLEVDKFPNVTLISANGKGGQGVGVIKIKGIEQKISGTYEVQGNMMSAHFSLKLSDFKIVGIKYMGIGVDDEVRVDVTVPVK